VFAACVNLGIGGSTNSWKIMFWVGAGFSIVVGFIRLCFPESRQFIEAKKAGHKNSSPGAFWAETKAMLQKEWRECSSQTPITYARLTDLKVWPSIVSF
jgi:Sugar (and other) transporter